MIAFDTNILIYAHRAGTPRHKAAQKAIELACDTAPCGIAISSLCEFWSIVTHKTASGRPSTLEEANSFIATLVAQVGLQVWQPGVDFGPRLLQLARDLSVSGVRIFDLQIALMAFENGATEIWTHDRNFVSLPGLHVRDPIS